MKDFRFFAELPEHRGSKSGSKQYSPFTIPWLRGRAAAGGQLNCLAVLLEDEQPLYQPGTDKMDAFVAVRDTSNSPVCLGQVSREYLRKRCVRISAELAQRLHPNLFSIIKD